ncbi:hypothetical protein WOLCODRAFT_153384 [Wolfiporia cocos MD-104 SS10]|uniref:Uncharacterized protein n=1 Tax=Wolfiporia cocos (strain MD-104) TaxID=742152 RepID=A0A2H3JMA4_WOLCO|nr:hypothetical protein WOLCODRAFT_153384 [Wolfiporia cocos MD-104 SS10]
MYARKEKSARRLVRQTMLGDNRRSRSSEGMSTRESVLQYLSDGEENQATTLQKNIRKDGALAVEKTADHSHKDRMISRPRVDLAPEDEASAGCLEMMSVLRLREHNGGLRGNIDLR